VDAHFAIEYVRVFLLVICLAIAGYSDFTKLIVKDRHWFFWTLPAIILLILDLIITNSSIWNFLMIFAILSLAASTVGIIPKFKGNSKINLINISLLMLYLLGIIGLLGGLLNYTNINYYSLILSEESKDVMLWWSMLNAIFLITVFIFVWKIELIRGGADIKALIWIIILIPSWTFIPQPYLHSHDIFLDIDIIFQLHPSFVLFLWASSIFLIAPIFFIIKNIIKRNINSLADLKMAWHAIKIPLSEIPGKDVWLLSDVILDESDNYLQTITLFFPQKEDQNLLEKVEKLRRYGLESAWVTKKHPFVTYLCIAILPMMLLGDPVALIMSIYYS